MLPTLSNGDIFLRPWVPADAADLERAMQDPETVRWMAIELPYERADAEGFIASTAQTWDDRQAAHFAISDGERLLGYLGVLSVEDRMRVVELGYWVAAAQRGRGVATASVRLALDWIRDELKPDRIELGMLTGNEASRAVAEKCGFVFAESRSDRPDGAEEWIFLLESDS